MIWKAYKTRGRDILCVAMNIWKAKMFLTEKRTPVVWNKGLLLTVPTLSE